MSKAVGFRMTAKYRAALQLARRLELPVQDNEDLYKMLAERNHFWNAKDGQWVVANPDEADSASRVLRIRVWIDKEIVEDLAHDLEMAWQGLGFTLIDKSQVYLCRPPKQNDGRVYLTFKRKE